MQCNRLKRREFISLLGSAAAWPLAARAQQGAVPMMGYLDQGPSEDAPELVAAFREASQEKSEHLKQRKVRDEVDR
jgi:putative ABC transport system substrate-binding protein